MSLRTNISGRTHLHDAAERKDINMARKLLAEGADPHKEDAAKMTPLTIAIQNQDEAMQALLLDKPWLSHEDLLSSPGKLLKYHSAVMQLIRNGSTDAIRRCLQLGMIDAKFLLTRPSTQSYSPIEVAISKDHIDLIRLCIEAIAHHKTKWPNKDKHLILALELGKSDAAKLLIAAGANAKELLVEAAKSGNLQQALILLDAGADVNCISEEWECTPLMMAATQNHTAIARALIGANADVNKNNSNYYRPLSTAITFENIEIINLLLQANAEVTKTALVLAQDKKNIDIINMLLTSLANKTTAQNLLPTINLIASLKRSDGLVKSYLMKTFHLSQEFSDIWDRHQQQKWGLFTPSSAVMDKIITCIHAADDREQDPSQQREYCELALDPPDQSLRAALLSSENKDASKNVRDATKQKYIELKKQLVQTFGSFPPRYKDAAALMTIAPSNPQPSAPARAMFAMSK